MEGGTNLLQVGDYNKDVVLKTIRLRGEAGRAEIAEEIGLTVQTVSNIVKRLLNEELVVEAGSEKSKRGKNRVKFRVNPDAAYALGIHVDADQTLSIIADLECNVIRSSRHPTLQEEGPFGIVNQVAGSLDRLVEEARIPPEKILGLGVAFPGPLDYETGVVHQPPNLLGWHEVALKEALEEETGHKVVVDNDATAAAIGERWAGESREAHNFALIYSNVGIGAGLFINNQVYRGSTTLAGAFGHMILDAEGPQCFCGNRGCIEAHCAPRSVVLAVKQRLRRQEASLMLDPFEAGSENINYRAVCKAALAGDTVALEEITNSAQLLGTGVANMVNLLDIELVLLAGTAFRDVQHLYLKQVEQALQEKVIAWNYRQVRAKMSSVGENAGVVGAASLVLHSAFGPELKGLK